MEGAEVSGAAESKAGGEMKRARTDEDSTMGQKEPSMYTIRAATVDDTSALFKVCLLTGDSGNDASKHFEKDHDALGRRWVGPYLCGPELPFALALQAKNSGRVHGYCLGSLDTLSFMERLRSEYMPPLQKAFPVAPIEIGQERTKQEEVYAEYHRILDAPTFVVAAYPSHLHIDMIPDAHGQGLGQQLMRLLLGNLRSAGSTGVHLEMHSGNLRARRFYERLGFREVARVIDDKQDRRIISGEGVHFLPPSEVAFASEVPLVDDVRFDWIYA
jgi:GNAT superfamily N-acetyltransferase